MKEMNIFASTEENKISNCFNALDSYKNGKNYGGTTYKFGITYNGKDYLVKYPKDNDLSVFTEYIASNLICSLGFKCQVVKIGYHGDTPVNIIEDFTDDCCELHSYKDTRQSSEDTDMSDKEYTYDDILYLIEKYLKLSEVDKALCIEQFWDMYIVDALLANRDRHWGNWGYLAYANNHYKVAPLYDNGACLFPSISAVIHQYPSADFMRERIFTFPASLMRIKRQDRSYRTNYYEIINSHNYKGLDARLEQFISRTSWKEIFSLAHEIIDPLDVQKELKSFWCNVICMRYRCILCNEDFNTVYTEVMDYERTKISKEAF